MGNSALTWILIGGAVIVGGFFLWKFWSDKKAEQGDLTKDPDPAEEAANPIDNGGSSNGGAVSTNGGGGRGGMFEILPIFGGGSKDAWELTE